jgi:hypothetical protein
MTHEIATPRIAKRSTIERRERWGVALRVIAGIIFLSFLLFREPDLERAYGLSTNGAAALQALWLSSLLLWFVGGSFVSTAKNERTSFQLEQEQLAEADRLEKERQLREVQALAEEQEQKRILCLYAEEAEKLRAGLAIGRNEIEKARAHFPGYLDQFALLQRGWAHSHINENSYLGLPAVVVASERGEQITMWPANLVEEYESQFLAANGPLCPDYTEYLLHLDDERNRLEAERQAAETERQRIEAERAVQLARQVVVNARDL